MYTSSVIGFLIVSGLFFAIILDPTVYQYLDSRLLLLTATGTLGLLTYREETERETRRLQTRLRRVKFTQSACIDDIDWESKRGL